MLGDVDVPESAVEVIDRAVIASMSTRDHTIFCSQNLPLPYMRVGPGIERSKISGCDNEHN